MLILPSVSFSSQEHPIVRFCLRLQLWSKPTLDDAESTADVIGSLLWTILAIVIIVQTMNLVISAAIIGILDHVGRFMGIRTTYVFVPLWILAVLVCIVGAIFPELAEIGGEQAVPPKSCLLYTSPSPRDRG